MKTQKSWRKRIYNQIYKILNCHKIADLKSRLAVGRQILLSLWKSLSDTNRFFKPVILTTNIGFGFTVVEWLTAQHFLICGIIVHANTYSLIEIKVFPTSFKIILLVNSIACFTITLERYCEELGTYNYLNFYSVKNFALPALFRSVSFLCFLGIRIFVGNQCAQCTLFAWLWSLKKFRYRVFVRNNVR